MEDIPLYDFLKAARPEWKRKDVQAVAVKLSRVGIWTSPELIEALQNRDVLGNLNCRLRAVGQKAFSSDTLTALRRCSRELPLPASLESSELYPEDSTPLTYSPGSSSMNFSVPYSPAGSDVLSQPLVSQVSTI